ncbi:type II toxin-antitoxin system PemI/MazE family antitoxin [Lentilactobacillus kisonensis]|uniref:Toxin-antitoxin system, antitoxin component, AbrB domain protein n=2 Tax=Lentilactobacillus kisonensis TaxID=481722 RepID=H1LF45_9LACO|nr:hypothetical protein [Lentilactobacillus kisonensis]EHO52105.1 toxin-antitoxin system, antitoxin component, AbrB domain protein [Lentilactobacillus kisonensis F0435]KRL20036.1 toxin-antitoxin system, antitoxin component, AbrB domain protein [Lentilactobacillus kisonensis DSM 19906 = JCM 15041]
MKARKQGNTLVLSIPKQFQVTEGAEFMSTQAEDGSITYVPKTPNIYEDPKYSNQDLRVKDDILDSDKTTGHEEL